MITFTINNKKLEVEEGTTVLEAALAAGIKIPTICYHKDLSPYGACRLCLVEIERRGKPRLEVSCLYKAEEGLKVKTDTPWVKKTRKIIFELLLAEAPDSEKIRNLAKEYGVTQSRIKLEKKGNCILCGLCARVCAEISKRNAINFANRGVRRRIQTPFDKTSETCIGCGACAYICPTNVIKIEEGE